MADITIAATSLVNYHEVGSVHELRVFSDRSWTASDDTPVPGRGNNDTYYASYTLTVNTTLFTAAIPSVTLKSNQDALNTVGKIAKWTAQVFVDGVPRDTFMPNILGAFTVPSSPTGTTWGALETVNSIRRDIPASPHPTLTQVQNLINIGLGTLNNASVGVLGRIETATAPFDAAHPKAVETGDPRLPGFVLHTSKYASLNAALTAIGVLGGGTVVVDASTPVTSNVATTASIALRVEGQGILTGTGKTVTIVGPLSAEPRQIFASGITVSFSGNSVVKHLQVAWWGADSAAAGAATSAALNAAFVAWPDASTMHLSPRKTYTHAGLTIDRKFQVTLLGNDSQDGYSVITQTGPTLIYAGTGGNAVTISNCYACTFRGFASVADATVGDGTSGATRNLYVTMVPGGFPPISSQNVFQSLMIQADTNGSAGIGRTDYVAIDIDNASQTNNEFHKILDCKITGARDVYPDQRGVGLRLGHANVKQVYVEGTTFGSLAVGILGVSGGFRGNHNAMGNCLVAYQGQFVDAVYIFGDDSESLVQVLKEVSGAPFTIIAGRYQDILGGAPTASATRTTDRVLWCVSSLTVIGTVFGSRSEAGNQNFSNQFMSGTNSAGPSAVGKLHWINSDGVGVDGNTPISDANFNYGLNTFQYASGDRNGQPFVAGALGSLRSFGSLSTSASYRDLIGIQTSQDPVFTTGEVAALDSTQIGDSAQIEIAKLARPERPDFTTVGTNDAGQQLGALAVLARDAFGNRTMVSQLRNNAPCNTTLSGSNYIHVFWPTVKWNAVAATDYLLLQFSAGAWRIIATITPIVGDVQSYDIVANPAAPFTYVPPTYNEVSTVILRGQTTFSASSPVAFTPVSPTQLVANTNNWNPAPTAPFPSTYIRATTDVSRNVTGITTTSGQVNGESHVLVNVGLADLVIKHQSASSTAANRFFCSTAADITLTPKQAADVIYDQTNGYWLVFKRN